MDILSIVRTLWRHRLAAIPVIVLTVAAAAYVYATTPPTYEARAAFVLINPRIPSQDQIDANPDLEGLDPNNIFVQLSDQFTVAQSVSDRLTRDPVFTELLEAGADPRFAVVPTAVAGSSLPRTEIVSIANDAPTAELTVRLVGEAFVDQLAAMQEEEGIDERVFISAYQPTRGTNAQLRISSLLRSVVAIFALGGMALFVVISIADAIAVKRAGGRPGSERRDDDGEEAEVATVLAVVGNTRSAAPTSLGERARSAPPPGVEQRSARRNAPGPSASPAPPSDSRGAKPSFRRRKDQPPSGTKGGQARPGEGRDRGWTPR